MREIDIQGHRGCRGLYPENTLEGFAYAVQLGVNTLELDVVINKDQEVVISHEPFYHADITTRMDGSYIDSKDQESFNIYHMGWEEMAMFDVGLKPHPRFKNQVKLPAKKPLLKDLFILNKTNQVRFNIEIKREAGNDGLFHPNVSTFCDLVVKIIEENEMMSRVNIQSFDKETLQYMHVKYPGIPLAFLTDDRWTTFGDHVASLGFTPAIYSPHYRLVNVPLVRYCHQKNVSVIPWTVNHIGVMRKMVSCGVDGIITDYPDKLITLLQK